MDLRELRQTPFRRHPWETVRAAFFASVLRRFARTSDVRSFLDVGAGDGWLAGMLLNELPNARATCVDTGHREDAAYPGDVVNAARIVRAAEIPDGQYDLVALMDLLEHVDDPSELLRSIVRQRCAEGARVLVSVPAWEQLYSSHDATFSHRKRYSPNELREMLERIGLEKVADGGLFHAALLPRAARVAAERVRGTNRNAKEPEPLRWDGSEPTARAVEAVLGAEAAASFAAARLGLHVPGLTAWALYRVPTRVNPRAKENAPRS